MNIENYRIKTEKEFIKEYGNNWRNLVKSNFPEKMDYLLGKKLIKCYIYYRGKDIIDIDNWIISKDMLKDITVENRKNKLNKIS